MWINEPTPVISSTKVSDSGSMNSPRSMFSDPDWIQVKIVTWCTRSVDGSPSTFRNTTKPSTNAAITVAQPIRWPIRSSTRPPTSSTIAPASGSAMSSTDAPYRPVTGSIPSESIQPSIPSRELLDLELEQVRVVDGGTAPAAEDGHDDRQPDDHLGGGHHHHEEREDDAIEVAPDVREGHQRQVHGIEHQLDAHEHHDCVFPDQEANRSDAEQQRGQDQVVVRGHRSPSCAGGAPADPRAPPSTSSSSARLGCSALSISVTELPLRNRLATRSLSENSTRSDTDPGAMDPSGSSAGVAFDDDLANTPGPGTGEIRSERIRSCTRCRWVFRSPGAFSMWVSTMAPVAAVISSALVSSNGNR